MRKLKHKSQLWPTMAAKQTFIVRTSGAVVVQLPQVYVDTDIEARVTDHTVLEGQSLQAALDQAMAGETWDIDAGPAGSVVLS